MGTCGYTVFAVDDQGWGGINTGAQTELAGTVQFGRNRSAVHHCFEFGAVNGHQFGAEQIEPARQEVEVLAQRLERLAVVLAEVGNRFEVRLQPARQPDEFQVATALAFQPTR